MTYLVTGGFGFVGSAVVTALLKAGMEVRVLDLPDHPLKAAFIKHWSTFGNPEILGGDIARADQVELAMTGCDRVVHAAALLNSIASFSQFHRVNVLGTENVCRAATLAGVQQLVVISTSDVFGIPSLGETITEESPLRSWGEPYADTKIQAVRTVRYYRQEKSLPVTLIYPGWVYGPGDRQFFPAIIDMIKDKHVFTWERRNPYEINLIYIDDLVNAIIKAATQPRSDNGEYLILDTHTFMSPARLFQAIADYVHQPIRIHHVPYPLMMLIAWCSQWLARKGIIKKHLLSTTDVKAFGNEFHFNNERAASKLGWKPATPVDVGMQRAMEWQEKRRNNPDLVG